MTTKAEPDFPDGKNSKSLGQINTWYLAFSKSGKPLYGIQWKDAEANNDRGATLFSLDPRTLKQKAIKALSKDFWPGSRSWPGIRFSLAPDGQSFVYSIAHDRMDLWMLRGYRQPGWWGRISDALNLK